MIRICHGVVQAKMAGRATQTIRLGAIPSTPPHLLQLQLRSATGIFRRLPTLPGRLRTCCSPSSQSRPLHSEHRNNRSGDGDRLTVDANFWFFLVFYYGIYVGVALIYITQLFGLYRLNWWPAALGAKTSYTFFWTGSLVAGWVLHELDPLGTETRHRPALHGAESQSHLNAPQPGMISLLALPDAAKLQQRSGALTVQALDTNPTIDDADIQWQRKTLWVGLAFAPWRCPP